MKSCPLSLQVKKGSGLQQNTCVSSFYRNSYLIFWQSQIDFYNFIFLAEEIRESKNVDF